jgi:hypothetical protein
MLATIKTRNFCLLAFCQKTYKLEHKRLQFRLRSECGSWLLSLKEEHRLRMFENRMLRRIFGQKRDEVAGRRRKRYNEVFVICSLGQI